MATAERSAPPENKYAFDDTPPASKVILAVAVLSAVTLLGLIPVFHSYFFYMTEQQLDMQVRDSSRYAGELEAHRAEQATKMAGVERAMTALGRGARMRATPITPQASEDLGAIEGWTRMKNEREMQAAQEAMGAAAAAAEAEAAAAAAAAEEGTEEGE